MEMMKGGNSEEEEILSPTTTTTTKFRTQQTQKRKHLPNQHDVDDVSNNNIDDYHIGGKTFVSNNAIISNGRSSNRRKFLNLATNAIIGTTTTSIIAAATTKSAAADVVAEESRVIISSSIDDKRRYYQRFPSLFSPLYGESKSSKQTLLKQVGDNIWFLEQSLEIGPLEVPIRCVVIKLKSSSSSSDDDGSGSNKLWIHSPLAPTMEYFELIESLGCEVGHIVVPTYALEHKIFTKDCIRRYPNAQLWVSQGQFTFPTTTILPKSKVSDEYIFGKKVSGILTSDRDNNNSNNNNININNNNKNIPSWSNEIEYETLEVGTFTIGGKQQTFYETTFFHKPSKSLIVTDAVEQINLTPPDSINNIENLLLVSKKSTSDPMPMDTLEARQIGWEKTALLVSYFFPEHEEFDPNTKKFGVVTWTDGWHTNFQILAGVLSTNNNNNNNTNNPPKKKNTRLIVPPVVRTLLYAENTTNIQSWLSHVIERWGDDMKYIIPAHFDAPIQATGDDLQRVFAYLDDNTIDPFPENDLKRGLKPIADIVYGSK